MAELKNVIYDIERCICHVPDACRDCSHYPDKNGGPIGCMEDLLSEALELLKEQQHEIWELQELNEHLEDKLKEREAVEPTLIREGRNKNYNDYVCPRCDNEVVYEQNYCSECGVQFLWEGR